MSECTQGAESKVGLGGTGCEVGRGLIEEENMAVRQLSQVHKADDRLFFLTDSIDEMKEVAAALEASALVKSRSLDSAG